jgi:hypothetical protein
MASPLTAFACTQCSKPSSGTCSACGAAAYCSVECQRAHWHAGHRLVCYAASAPLGNNGATEVHSGDSGLGREARARLAALRTPQERDAWRRLERGLRDEKQRVALVEQVADFSRRGGTALGEVIATFSELVTGIDALAAAERPRGWNSEAAHVAFAGATLAMTRVWQSRASPDAGTVAMEELDIHLTALFEAMGLVDHQRQLSHDAVLERLAEHVADEILAVLDTEATRLGHSTTRPTAPPMGAFAWPDVAESERPATPLTREEYAADARRTEEELAGLQSELDETTATWFTKLRLAAARKINSRTENDRPWLLQKTLDVIYGFAIMAVVGAGIYGIGRVSMNGLFAARDDIKAHFERTGVALASATTDVREAQEKIGGVRSMLGAGLERLKRAQPLWKDGQDIPPTVAGIAVVQKTLDDHRASWMGAWLADHAGANAEGAQNAYEKIYRQAETFAALRKDFGKLPLSAFQGRMREFVDALRADEKWHVKQYQVFTLKEIARMHASLGEADRQLAGAGQTLADLAEANLKGRAQFQKLSDMEDIFRTKSPISAYLAHVLGQGSELAGQAIWHTTAPFLWFQHVESLVNISFAGVSELFANGFSSFFAATSWGYLFKLMHALAATLQGGFWVTAKLFRAVELAARAASKANAALDTVAAGTAGVATFLEACASHLGDLAAVLAFAQGVFVHIATVVSIVQSLWTILSLLVATCSAYVLGVALVVGLAVYLLVLRDTRSPMAAAGHVARALFAYGWIIQPALIGLVYVAQYAAFGAAGLADEASKTPGLHPIAAGAVETLSEVGQRKAALAELAAEVSDNNTKLMDAVRVLPADELRAENESYVRSALAGVFGGREVPA